VVPSILAATTYSRASVDVAPSASNGQSVRAARKISDVDFPTDLEEIPPLPVVQSPVQGRFLGKASVINASRRPYKTVPLRRGRQGATKGTQSLPDPENDLPFVEKTPLVLLARLRAPRIPAGPFIDSNGLGR